jgi:hypothetical protein
MRPVRRATLKRDLAFLEGVGGEKFLYRLRR